MPLTRGFKAAVQICAQRDPAFREGLLKEGFACLLGRRVCLAVATESLPFLPVLRFLELLPV